MERKEKMKKSLAFLISVFLIFLTACGGAKDTGTAYTEVNVEEGITLTLEEDTLKSSRATFLLANNTEEAVNYSTNEYHFEQMNDGQWKEFTGTAESNWGDETSVLEAGEEIALSYNWKTFCGATTEGTQYRLIIMVNDSPVAAEFTGI
ncbi:immunoglobulin-like domain-containing protein [Anaerotignum sp.]|uniref:immunoglobulin-like domain-containing protein n=1 Tax=Anaerotignum sp. TaxID=2039241 RepID=UPI00271505BF|nr:immunoglobulin-like domain-containing protein [Anaerotignum sp.]